MALIWTWMPFALSAVLTSWQAAVFFRQSQHELGIVFVCYVGANIAYMVQVIRNGG